MEIRARAPRRAGDYSGSRFEPAVGPSPLRGVPEVRAARLIWIFMAIVWLQACSTNEMPIVDEAPSTAVAPVVMVGNGDSNWIVVEGVTRSGSTFTFSKVRIDGAGWLVLHPFRNGRPFGEIYAGASYLEDGPNQNVEIRVDKLPAPGEMFFVMLHSDVNENQIFDFVFVDAVNVLDKAVLEGSTMIGHPFAAPQ